MIVSLIVFFVVVILSIPSAVIFIPLTIITGNPTPLYNVACAIVRIAFRTAGIRFQVQGAKFSSGPGEHLHGQPCIESRPASIAFEPSRAHRSLSQALT